MRSAGIRWTDSDPAVAARVDRRAILFNFFVQYLIAYALDLTVVFCLLMATQAVEGGIVLVLDLMLLPVAFPIAALIFVPSARQLVKMGRFGFVQSVALAIFAIMLATGLFLFGMEGRIYLDAIPFAFNYGVSCGLPVGALVWRRMALEYPVFFLRLAGRPPSFRTVCLFCAAVIVPWQLLFWFVL